MHVLQVVDKDGIILEKAQDEAEATRMLSMLAGTTHQVHTGDSPVPWHAANSGHHSIAYI